MTVMMGSIGVLSPMRCLLKPGKLYSRAPFSAKIRAASTGMSTIEINAETIPDARNSIIRKSLACPICYYPLINDTNAATNLLAPSGCWIKCDRCKKDYRGNEAYLDLTMAAGSDEYVELRAASAENFRGSPLPYLYERGYRELFKWGGFPGPEREFEMAMKYLEPTIGGTIIDASCGTGMFSRLFAKSGMYSLVVPLDYSEDMLRQTHDYIKQEGISMEKLSLVRADIARLPFVSSSIDAVHAGAALHCWPSPTAGVAEISRILRPGGVFVTTTFVFDNVPVPMPVVKMARNWSAGFQNYFFFLAEHELEDLCKTCGLENFTAVRNSQFVMISATKPR